MGTKIREGEAKPNKGGRPSKFQESYIQQVVHLCKLGATSQEIADALGVGLTTIKRWMDENEQFRAAVKDGKALADERVVKALFSRAIGCHIQDSDIRVIEGQIVITPLEKHFPPDTAACMAWLHNRRPDEWKPRKAADPDGEDDSITSALNKIVERLHG